jgi:hypothetical protein
MSFEQPVTSAEADLERLLSIEPSAAFRARVRERVASESIGRRSWPSLIVLVHAGALIAVVVALLMPSRDVTFPTPPAAPRLAAAIHRPDAVPLMTRPRPIATPQVARQQAPRRIAREPEVVWDAQGADAIARVVELARRGTIITAPKPPEPNPLAVQPLAVVPIVVDSLIPSTGSERSSS